MSNVNIQMLKFSLFLILLLSSGFAWCDTNKVTGMFSDMHYINESGDVIGTEIFIVYGSSGYYAIMQCAEGSPSKPVLVKATIKNNEVKLESATEESNCPMGVFSGKVNSNYLRGKFEGTEYSVILKRKKSYWQ